MANPLGSIRGALQGLFTKGSSKGESVVGIDIGTSAIKVVQLRNRGGVAVLETYGELALGPYSGVEIGRATNLPAEKIAEALTDLVREANVTAKVAGVSIPFSSSLISLIELPRVAPKQLASMIPIEARKYIPVPISEVTLDWFVVPDEEAEYLTGDKQAEGPAKTNVLLVAIHNETLAKFQDIVKQSNLAASFYEIEIFSAARSVLDQGIAPVAVLDLGAASTKLYIVEYGIVRVSHNINKGAQDITLALSRALNISVEKAERLKREYGINASTGGEGGDLKETSLLTLDQIFSEANRTILSYQRKYNKNVSKVILTGGGAVLKGLVPLAEKDFETEIALGNPFGKVEAPAFLGDVLSEAGPEFSVAVGLALRKLQEKA